MNITALYTYPVKSLAGISLPQTRLEKRGLAYDRRWMLIDRDGHFLSQREIPQLALLLPDLTADSLIIRHRHEGLEPLAVPLLPSEEGRTVKVQVWDDQCAAVRASREADEWFSEVLGSQCHLVYMPETSLRPINPAYGRPGEITSFADSCPMLIIGEASLAALNRRLAEPVPMNRFRPNIVFAGGQPFDEESWKAFSMGGASFRGIRPCARCQMTTIDQETAEMGKEPLRTLSTFRRQGRKVLFGLNAAWKPQNGERAQLQVGDSIQIEARQ